LARRPEFDTYALTQQMSFQFPRELHLYQRYIVFVKILTAYPIMLDAEAYVWPCLLHLQTQNSSFLVKGNTPTSEIFGPISCQFWNIGDEENVLVTSVFDSFVFLIDA